MPWCIFYTERARSVRHPRITLRRTQPSSQPLTDAAASHCHWSSRQQQEAYKRPFLPPLPFSPCVCGPFVIGSPACALPRPPHTRMLAARPAEQPLKTKNLFLM